MPNEKPGQSEIKTTLFQHAAKSAFLIYMKETSVFRKDKAPAFILGKEINQVILDSSMKVAKHKKTGFNGWYGHGIEYISFGKPDQEQKKRFLFIDDFNAEIIEFQSEQEALSILEFNK